MLFNKVWVSLWWLSDYGLLVAQNGDTAFVEAVRILLGGDVKIDGEDEVRPGEVQVHGQSHLQRDGDTRVSLTFWSRSRAGASSGRVLYHVPLLGGALLDPAELSEGQIGGDGGG